MSFRLRGKKPIRKELRRVIEEQIDAAILELKNSRSGQRGEAVHEARKHLKHVRALLRLVSDCLGHGAVKKEDKIFRNVARSLSPLRDTNVRSSALTLFRRNARNRTHSAAFRRIEAALRAEYQRVQRRTSNVPMIRELVRNLKSSRRPAKWRVLSGIEQTDLLRALRRSYKKTFKAMQRAAGDPSDEYLHEWRKECKDHGCHLRLLRDLSDTSTTAQLQPLRVLGDLLGDDHDLAGLAATLQKRAGKSIPHADVVSALPLIAAKRRLLQRRIGMFGRRIYKAEG